VQPNTIPLNDAVEMVAKPMIQAGGSCIHIMALHFDPREESDLGVIRCIESRTGEVDVSGFVDRSQLHLVEVESLYAATMGPRLEMAEREAVLSGLDEHGNWEFLGFEDPIVWREEGGETLHLYFTIPFREPESGRTVMYLGHASGPDLRSLTMTEPVLGPNPGVHGGAKEPVVAPPSADENRHNLVESNDSIGDTTFSVLRTAVAESPGEPWTYGDLVFHPARDGYEWCAGHASPGPFLPQSFVDVGAGKRVCLLNGREANREEGETVSFGTFAVGLLIYDYESGSVEWVSEEPLIRDPAARTITFASAFRQIDENRGAVYAHVDDSYVRVYHLDANALAASLP
jgi:hypothetical protein